MYVKNTASQNLPFVLIKAADGTALTGATVTAKRCIDGGAQGDCTGTVSEKAGGQYNLALSQADTNGDTVGYLFTATSAIPVHITISFMTAANLPADLQSIGGVAQSATDLKDFADTGYDPATHALAVAVPKSPATLAAADVSGNLPADLKAITAGVDFSATMKTALNAATPASVTGAVGSVAAAVTITSNADITAIKGATDKLGFTGGGPYLVNSQVKGQDNIDFGALQKASLNAATPASVGSVTGAVASVSGAVGSVTTDVGITQAGADKVWGSAARSLTDKAGFSLSSGQFFIKKNTQVTISFPMTDSTNHAPAIGLTVTAKRSIDGAALAGTANNPTELSDGLYRLVVAAADVNGAFITFEFSAVGADTRFLSVITQP